MQLTKTMNKKTTVNDSQMAKARARKETQRGNPSCTVQEQVFFLKNKELQKVQIITTQKVTVRKKTRSSLAFYSAYLGKEKTEPRSKAAQHSCIPTHMVFDFIH